MDVYQVLAILEGGTNNYFRGDISHLIAGPVLHHKDMIIQFECPCELSLVVSKFCLLTFLFVMGLSKNVLIASSLLFVSPVFDKGTNFCSIYTSMDRIISLFT